VLVRLSGRLNTSRLAHTYEDLNQYKEHGTRTLTDRDCAEAGQQLGFVDGSVRYEMSRQI